MAGLAVGLDVELSVALAVALASGSVLGGFSVEHEDAFLELGRKMCCSGCHPYVTSSNGAPKRSCT